MHLKRTKEEEMNSYKTGQQLLGGRGFQSCKHDVETTRAGGNPGNESRWCHDACAKSTGRRNCTQSMLRFKMRSNAEQNIHEWTWNASDIIVWSRSACSYQIFMLKQFYLFPLSLSYSSLNFPLSVTHKLMQAHTLTHITVFPSLSTNTKKRWIMK